MADANQPVDVADQQAQDTNQTQVSPAVGQFQKEAEPLVHTEFIKPSEQEPHLHPEVSEAGVEATKELHDLTLKDVANIAPAKEHTEVLTQPTGAVVLPNTPEEAKAGAKGSAGNSTTWLSSLILKIFKKLAHGG